MKKINYRIIAAFILCFLFQSIAKTAFCQDDQPINIEQQLENITEAVDDLETEDDSYLQSLHHFLKEPVNVNYADAGLLEQLQLLSPVQIANLLSYRKIFGLFINMYELQAIPGWDVKLIRKIRPYITVSQKIDLYSSLLSRLKSGTTTLLIRSSQILEKSKGYLLDSSNSTNFYQGSPQKLLIRYKYIFKNQLQYGFTAEKDAGEQFFRGSQRKGFDFYSAHFFVRNLGVIKSLAFGDFAVNLGQGLIQWQSLAFNKGADIINVKRQSDVLRPYNSAGEIIFNRGAGITIKKDGWESTFFVSYRKLDAGFDADTLSAEDKITSLHTSGYHRTANEIAGKNVQGILTIGGNFCFTDEKFHAGINAIQHHFDHPIKKPDYLYNKYAIAGKKLGNYSLDYSYTFKNMHIFGEAAVDDHLNNALITGLLISTDSKVDMSFLYRNISKSYQSLYSNAFTENSSAVNERGFYSSITISPTDFLRIDAYADFFHFPWLKYRTDAPTSGNDYMLQLSCKPNKQAEFMVRYKDEMKPINYNPDGSILNPVVGKAKQNLRIQYSYKLDREFTTRSRVELCWFDKRSSAAENGFLIYTDLIFKPLRKKYSGNIRGMYFETDGYNSRFYAFENDVLYGYSIPVFFDKGFRYYINVNYDFNRKLSGWIRMAQTVYPEKLFYGSGLDLINNSKKTECRVQLMYTFAKN